MRIFLSWSGAESKRVAAALKPWLEGLLPGVSAWMSDRDLQVGTPWGTELHEQLKAADFGVLCLTADNLAAPWILYEAGALAMSSRAGCVVPYLLHVGPGKLPSPLAQFQSVPADKEGTWRVVRTIDAAHDRGVGEAALREVFGGRWPELARHLGVDVEVSVRGGVHVLAPTEAQFRSEADIEALRARLKAVLRSERPRLVIDLSGVQFVSSLGMSIVLPVLAATKRQEADVVFACMHPLVRAAFESTRLLELIRHFPTLDEALAYFEEKEPSSGQPA